MMYIAGEKSGLFSGSSGAELCQALIKAFDAVVHRQFEQAFPVKLAVTNALKSLLAISMAAKMAALEGMHPPPKCMGVRGWNLI